MKKLHLPISLILLLNYQIITAKEKISTASCNSSQYFKNQRNQCREEKKSLHNKLDQCIEESDKKVTGCTDQDSTIECRNKFMKHVKSFDYDVNVDVQFYVLFETLADLKKETDGVQKSDSNHDHASHSHGNHSHDDHNHVGHSHNHSHDHNGSSHEEQSLNYFCLNNENDKTCLSRLKYYLNNVFKTPKSLDRKNDVATYENLLIHNINNGRNENSFLEEQFDRCRDDCNESSKNAVAKCYEDFLECKKELSLVEEGICSQCVEERQKSVQSLQSANALVVNKRQCSKPSYMEIANLISYKSNGVKVEYDNDSIILRKFSESWITGQLIIPLSRVPVLFIYSITHTTHNTKMPKNAQKGVENN